MFESTSSLKSSYWTSSDSTESETTSSGSTRNLSRGGIDCVSGLLCFNNKNSRQRLLKHKLLEKNISGWQLLWIKSTLSLCNVQSKETSLWGLALGRPRTDNSMEKHFIIQFLRRPSLRLIQFIKSHYHGIKNRSRGSILASRGSSRLNYLKGGQLKDHTLSFHGISIVRWIWRIHLF